jgi:2-polyprenyl-6-hydroxyphenyl methylase/3-demethylubiquinone-9 3-methyltransferase
MLASVLKPGDRVLDMAAAQGNFSLALAEMGFAVTWNDIREDLVEYVRLKYEFGTIDYAPGNAFEVEFPHLFDAVLITEVIEHVAHPDQFLARVATLVKPGGHVVMTTPNGAYFRNTLPRFSSCADPSVYEAIQFKPDADGHIFLMHPDELAPLAAQAMLTIESVTMFNNPLTSGYLGSRAVLKRLPRSFVNFAERLSQRLPSLLAERLLVQMAVLLRRPLDSTRGQNRSSASPAATSPSRAVA